MDEVEKALGAWQRIYAQLLAAQQRNLEDSEDGDSQLDPAVVHLKEQEEIALRAVQTALASAAHRHGQESCRS